MAGVRPLAQMILTLLSIRRTPEISWGRGEQGLGRGMRGGIDQPLTRHGWTGMPVVNTKIPLRISNNSHHAPPMKRRGSKGKNLEWR